MSAKVKVAVIGVGALGKEHARVYAGLAQSGAVEFVGVLDANREMAEQQAQRHGVPVFNNLQEVAEAAEAVSVVTPTSTHYDISRELLERGCHVLVEKPMTRLADEATALVALARDRGRVLQVGHVERFNPVFEFLEQVATDPRFIECHRLSPFPARSTDIGVVLDLMIHDLDVVLAFVKSPVVEINAVGIPVLSSSEDIANARLRFANGCVANLTASRISPERMRKIRVFSAGSMTSYISLDYRQQEGFIYRLARHDEAETSLWRKLIQAKDAAIISEFAGRRIVREPVPIRKEEPLTLELTHFVECVQACQTPRVSGEQARAALDVAFEIVRQVQASHSGNVAESPATS